VMAVIAKSCRPCCVCPPCSPPATRGSYLQ